MVHLIHHRGRHATTDETARETTDATTDETTREPTREQAHERAGQTAEGARRQRTYEKFGGVNAGAAFSGWLVAVALTVLLSSTIGAVAAAVGASADITQDEAEREAGAIGLAAAIAIVVVMVIAYYAGGYVAGRMSRFDGGRQGLAVWLIGFVVTLLAVGLGAIFGNEYNVMDRVDLPRIPIPASTATWGGIITGVVLLIGSLLAAMSGGKVGHRYHDRVDRAAGR